MNMSNMVGVGPFLTIPLIVASMGGPQAMLGWVLGALLAVCDGMVWAELASAIPSSGGTLRVPEGRLLRHAPGGGCSPSYSSGNSSSPDRWKSPRATSASPNMPPTSCRSGRTHVQALAVAVGLLVVLLLYRKIESVGKLMVAAVGGHDSHRRHRLGLRPVAFRRRTWSSPSRPGPSPSPAASCWGWARPCCWRCTISSATTASAISATRCRPPSRTMPRSILISVVAIAVDLPGDECVDHQRGALAGGHAVAVHRRRSSWNALYGPVGRG